MTRPGDRSPDDRDEPERADAVPTQAELDAQDLAELARTSKDADFHDRYPRRPADPGPAPRPLSRAAGLWWLGAVAVIGYVVYGLIDRNTIRDGLAARLEPGMVEIDDADAAGRAADMAGFWPPALLIGMPVLMALTYPLLAGIANHHSRNLRSIYGAVTLVVLIFTPVVADLVLSYEQIPLIVRALPWVQFGALVLSLLMVFRRSVNQWLPSSTRVKPTRLLRSE